MARPHVRVERRRLWDRVGDAAGFSEIGLVLPVAPGNGVAVSLPGGTPVPRGARVSESEWEVMSDVTRILSAIEKGDPHAATELLPLVYDELRRLAASWMAQERLGHTLQATALVHEAYIRLVDGDAVLDWDSRGHFFSAAAEAMRRVLIDNARRNQSAKRGAGWQRQELIENELVIDSTGDDLITVDEVLSRLGEQEPELAKLVELRFFAGLTVEEAARCLGISERTAYRNWTYARAWLRRELDRSRRDELRP